MRKKLDVVNAAKNSNLQTVMPALMDIMVTQNAVNVIAILMVQMGIIAKQSMEHVLAKKTLLEIIVSNVPVDSFYILSVNLVNVMILGRSTMIAISRTDNVNV